jgi:hypothetical protein
MTFWQSTSRLEVVVQSPAIELNVAVGFCASRKIRFVFLGETLK